MVHQATDDEQDNRIIPQQNGNKTRGKNENYTLRREKGRMES